jgi:5-methylcytosine-specific restriction endonuclease McrA
MESFDWKNEIISWTNHRRVAKNFQDNLIIFFQNAFNSSSQPEKFYFGTTSGSASIIIGGIYLAAIHSSNTISLLLDKEIKTIKGVNTEIAKSTRKSSSPLYWFETSDLSLLKNINENKEIWESYHRASTKIFESKAISTYRERIARNKVLIANFWKLDNVDVEQDTRRVAQIEEEFQNEVMYVRRLTKEERQIKLSESNSQPTKTYLWKAIFHRNKYVVAEILDRAGGTCERCNNAAPFFRDSNDEPYLEVHHIVPLAEGGNDTIENAIGLCPNCHRQAHYGKNAY